MILLLFLLQLKHFIFDFLYQPPWQYKNKGTWGHWGGIVHSLQHAIPTFLILLIFLSGPYAACIATIEFIVHYCVDWSKMNLNSYMKWGPTTSENFWRLLGFDQLLHQLTYVFIIWYTFNSV